MTILGTSCKGCAFFLSENSNQAGCQLNRLEKYPNLKVWDGNGVHYVLTQNLCPARRDEKWLEDKINPCEAVSDELFPKVKMIVVIKDNSHWPIFDDKQLELFNSVDILYFGGTTSDLDDRIHSRGFLKENKYLLERENFHIHYCYGELEDHLNQFASNGDHQYYLVVSDKQWELPENFLKSLNKYINEYIGYIAMIKPTQCYNGLFVNKSFHKELDGFGMQSIVEKIEIDKINREYESWVFNSMDDFLPEVENGTT